MPITYEEVDGGLTRVVWKAKITELHSQCSEKFRLDLFHPSTSYIVACHLTTVPIKNRINTYTIQLSLVWFRKSFVDDNGNVQHSGQPAKSDGSRQEIPHHRPIEVWASTSGSAKSKLRETLENTRRLWTSQRFIITFNRSSLVANLCHKRPLPLTCLFWIQFETFSRGEKNALKQLSELFTQQTNCDVQFCFKEDKHIGSHVTILSARSPVFAAMFQHDMRESKTGHVPISDIEPEVFHDMLYYIYAGRVRMPLDEHAAQQLFIAADKYDIKDLKEECVRFLLTCIRLDNALKLMAWAYLHLSDELKEATLDFASQHGKTICQQSDWEKLTINYPELSVMASRRMIK